MADFGEQVAAMAEKYKVRLDTVVKKTVIDMSARMILMSPVDTGRFRANRVFGQGAINAVIDQLPGVDSVGAVRAAIAAAPIGGSWYVTNSLPCARRLENCPQSCARGKFRIRDPLQSPPDSPRI